MSGIFVTDDGKEVAAKIVNGRLVIDAAGFHEATAWELKDIGMCNGPVCIPLRGIEVASGDGLDALRLAEVLRRRVVIDEGAQSGALGADPHVRTAGLSDRVAPEVVLPDLDGSDHALSDLRGSKALLVTFATWCGCRYDLPGWQALVDELAEFDLKVYAVAVDDQIIYSRKLDTPRPPASLTKLLSALVILDHNWNADAPVQISEHAATVQGSRVGLRSGDAVRAGDLLTAMIVRSGNDACLAMAEHVGGSEQGFVKLMNEKALALGMHSSSFRNPCGLDSDGHLSTARDLLTLARASAAHPEIAERANSLRGEFRTLNSNRRIQFKNTNAILGREPDTVGLKTGFTNKAGKCLIALAEHGAHKVWVVLLHAPNRWPAATKMLARGVSLVESAPPRH